MKQKLRKHNKSVIISPKTLIFSCLFFTLLGVVILTLFSGGDLPAGSSTPPSPELHSSPVTRARSCATVEEMGKESVGSFGSVESWKESLKVRRVIRDHFEIHGASQVRLLPPEQFCKHGLVMGKASEAGFGSEMYKILTAASLSIMLNRSLITGQTRHIGTSIHLGNI